MSMEGYVNASAEFSWQEHNFLWKGDRRYHDFTPGNEYNASCEYPRMWDQDGYRIDEDVVAQQKGCKSSEFDLVGICHCYRLVPTDISSTAISKAPEHTLHGSRSYQISPRFRTAYGSGGTMFSTRSRSCLASRSQCWTLMASAWIRHCRRHLTSWPSSRRGSGNVGDNTARIISSW